MIASEAGKGLLETYKQKVRDRDIPLGIVSFMGVFYDRPDIVDIQTEAVRFAVEKLLRLHVVGKIRGIYPLVKTEEITVHCMHNAFLG